MTSAANLLQGETLLTIPEAAKNFNGITIPVETLRKYIYRGVGGIKLESVSLNGRYTSKEAIQRFLERRQNPQQPETPVSKKMPQEEIDAKLRKHGFL